MYYLGIDYGTVNLKTAVYDSNYTSSYRNMMTGIGLFNLTRAQGTYVLPHIVYLSRDRILVSGTNNNRSFFRVSNLKRHLEDKEWKEFITPRNKYMTAMEIAEEEFKWILERFIESYNCPPDKVVITVPVSFSEMQKKRITTAAKNAGLNVTDTITEPFAGMFTQWRMFSEGINKDFCFLIFDFGGGTLDLSIFKISPPSETGNPSVIETLASKGIHFGGNDITELIKEKLIISEHQQVVEEIIKAEFQNRFLNDDNIPAEDKVVDSVKYIQNLKNSEKNIYDLLNTEINRFKEEICTYYNIDGETDPLDFICNEFKLDKLNDLEISMSYDELIEVIKSSGIVEKIIDAMDWLISQSLVRAVDIKKVIFIGGTSKIAFFKEVIENYIKETVEIERSDYENQKEMEQDFVFFDNDIAEDDWDDSPAEFVNLDDDLKFNAVALGSVTYLKYNNSEFICRNRLSYEIGTFVKDEYTIAKTTSDLCNDWTRGICVQPEKTDSGELIVQLYQTFGDTENKIYMGYLKLDNSIFSAENSYLMELMVDNNGIVKGRFFSFQHQMYEAVPLTEPIEITLEE